MSNVKAAMPQWVHWLNRLHKITGLIALRGGKELPLQDFANELRSLAMNMETEAERIEHDA